MLYRIRYEDKYHTMKTLVCDAKYYSELEKFAKTLGNVISIDPIDVEAVLQQAKHKFAEENTDI